MPHAYEIMKKCFRDGRIVAFSQYGFSSREIAQEVDITYSEIDKILRKKHRNALRLQIPNEKQKIDCSEKNGKIKFINCCATNAQGVNSTGKSRRQRCNSLAIFIL
jgi:transposase